MNHKNILPVAVGLLLLACQSDARQHASKADTLVKENVLTAVKDYGLNRFVFDTTKEFSSADSLIAYWHLLQQKFILFNEKEWPAMGKPTQLKIMVDSVQYSNSDYLAYASVKFLTAKPLKEEKELFMLSGAADLHAPFISYQQVKDLLEQFPAAVKRKAQWQTIMKKLEKNKGITVHSENLMRYLVQDIDGRSYSIADLVKGTKDYYLLVFGASWCYPCRLENHALKSVVNEPAHSNMQIIGISVDTNTEKWRKALSEDKCSWPQYADHGGLESSQARSIQLTGVPDNILLDKRGNALYRSSSLEKVLQWKKNNM